MLMTTPKLIFLRFYNLILGRFSFGKKLLRKFLEFLLINTKMNGKRYSPCTRYFSIKYFEDYGQRKGN